MYGNTTYDPKRTPTSKTSNSITSYFFSYRLYDFRAPSAPENVTPAVSIGLVYLIIIALFTFHLLFHAIFNRRKTDTSVKYRSTSIRSVYKNEKARRGVLTKFLIAIATFSHTKPSADIPRELIIQQTTKVPFPYAVGLIAGSIGLYLKIAPETLVREEEVSAYCCHSAPDDQEMIMQRRAAP